MAALSVQAGYSGAHGNPPPPPPLTMAGGPPQQGPSVLQILAMGQERNHAADAMAHHPRIESLVKLGKEAEATWLQIGQTAEAVGDFDRAIAAYESALRHNAYSVVALSQIAAICRSREEFKKAAEYFGRVVGIAPESGDVWGALGHCYLMVDDLKKAYSSYQQALYYMPNPHEPKLWYGIGILYDRYGSLEHAEEAFSSVIRMDPNFEKANEIFFRLGIIYKQQRKSAQSLECFRYILNNPPRPLTEIDIWFQIGHVYEQQKDFVAAKESYERVLQENPAHAKVLQQLGGLYHRSRAPFYNPEVSVQILTKSLESDPNDPFSWYLLGRAYMTTNNFGKAYEAYQQAVYRDGKNPAFWCSIGVLYYNINQFHDALDAYSRAIRIHPYLGEVWFNLGALYEACNDQMTDAIDAYQRTLQLDPSNQAVAQRLREIREHQASGAPLSTPPPPKDISPSSLSWNYATNSGGAPASIGQAGLGLDVSPPLPTQPGSAAGPPGTGGRTGGSGSPPVNGHRFEPQPPNTAGSRPRSTDPYRRASGTHHSPSNSIDHSPRTGAAAGQAAHRLAQIKNLATDGRGPPPVAQRTGSPPSPRTRTTEGGVNSHVPPPPPGGYPFPSHLAAAGPPSNGDAMDWERANASRQGSSAGPKSAHGGPPPPPLPRMHPHAHPHSPPVHPAAASAGAGPYAQHPPPPPHPHAHPHAHAHQFDRHGPPPASRGSFYDNPPPGPYGGYPPAASTSAAGEYARRRSSGSSHPGQQSAGTEVKVESAAPAAVPVKGRGGRKKASTEAGEVASVTPAKKGGRKGKAAASAGADGEPVSTTPKKKRETKAQKEKAAQAQAQAQAQEKDAAAKAAAVLNGVANSAQRPSQPRRNVDEDYDEGVDALMSLSTPAPHAKASPAATSPVPAPASVPPPRPSVSASSTPIPPTIPPPPPSNPRKRSLQPDATEAATETRASASASAEATETNASEPDAKRQKNDVGEEKSSEEGELKTNGSADELTKEPAPTEKSDAAAESKEEEEEEEEEEEGEVTPSTA